MNTVQLSYQGWNRHEMPPSYLYFRNNVKKKAVRDMGKK